MKVIIKFKNQTLKARLMYFDELPQKWDIIKIYPLVLEVLQRNIRLEWISPTDSFNNIDCYTNCCEYEILCDDFIS